MRRILIRISALAIVIASLASSQPTQSAILIGAAALHLGMEKQDVLSKLSTCCKTALLGALLSLGDTSLMVTNKSDVNDVYGNVYFRNGRVTGVLANRDWRPEPDAYKSAFSLVSFGGRHITRPANTGNDVEQNKGDAERFQQERTDPHWIMGGRSLWK